MGKIKDGDETTTEEISKDYSNLSLARTTVITKINEKLVKGYKPRDAVRNEIDEEKKEDRGKNLKKK